jgi:hypothetical protein
MGINGNLWATTKILFRDDAESSMLLGSRKPPLQILGAQPKAHR